MTRPQRTFWSSWRMGETIARSVSCSDDVISAVIVFSRRAWFRFAGSWNFFFVLTVKESFGILFSFFEYFANAYDSSRFIPTIEVDIGGPVAFEWPLNRWPYMPDYMGPTVNAENEDNHLFWAVNYRSQAMMEMTLRCHSDQTHLRLSNRKINY